MADGTVVVTPAVGPNASIDNDSISDGAGGTVYRQRTRLGGAGYHELAVVTNATPGGTDYGLVVRAAGGATEATLASVLATLTDMEITTDQISIDAGTINLSTDQLEALVAAVRDRLPAALDGDGGLKAHITNTVAVTGTFFQATQPVSGTVAISGTVPVSGTVTATGPLTDTQLRASAVSVTDARLPAALDADGGVKTHVQNFPATQPVSGTVAISGTVPVSGPLTDTQIRAAALPVSGTVAVSGTVPVSGPLTDTQLRATAVPVSGTVTATGPLTDTQLRATTVPVSGTVTATGPLTDTQLRATAVPVSGAFFQATQPVSGTVTATGPLTDTQLRATAVPVSGSVNITDPDSVGLGTITTTDLVVPAPAGTGALVSGASTAGSTVFVACQGGDSAWIIQVAGLTSGTLYFEGSLDSTNGADGNWINVNGRQTGLTNTVLSGNATTNGIWRGNTSGLKYLRLRSVGALTGTPAIVMRISGGTGAIFLNASIPTGSNTIGTVAVSGAVNPTTPSTLRNGQITVTTSGTRVALAGSTAVVSVLVQALSTNTGSIWVGDSAVSVSNGFELQPGQSTGIAIDNLSKVFVDATTNGDKACFLGS